MQVFIKKFVIKKLFGTITVHLKFTDNAKIIAGENGCGKTTILNIIYYTLCDNDMEFVKLKYYDFESIFVEFQGGKSVNFSKKDVIIWEQRRIPMEVRRLYRFLPSSKVDELIQFVKENRNEKQIEEVLSQYGISFGRFKRYVCDMTEQEEMKATLEGMRKTIKSQVPGKVLYLPTFRRIEDDLKSLSVDSSYTRKLSAEIGINFGMKDVENLLQQTMKKIQDAYRNGFSKMFTEMMLDFYNNREMKNQDIENPQEVLTVVERLGDEMIQSDEKADIAKKLRTYLSGNMENYEYNYFLNKLSLIFEQQIQAENALHNFAEKCNFYLYNKEARIDGNTLEFGIYEKSGMGRKVELEQLSSGEKQIVALFAKLFLDDENTYVILFDEPEISLSLEWQRTYLRDVYHMEKCKFLLAVTHSPFVFENELDSYACSLSTYIEEE